MKRTGKIIITLALFFSELIAQKINFTSSVDRTSIAEDDQVQLTVTVEGANIGSVPPPNVPDMPDWAILGSTTSSSTSINIIGGKMETKVSKNFIYILSPRKTGKLTIPSFSINIGGNTYTTEPITVEVFPGGQAAPQQTMPQQSGKRAEPRFGTEAETGNKVFVSCWASKKKAYVGEEITVEFWLYTRLNLMQLSVSKDAKMEGFWVSTDYTAKSLEYQPKVINGIRYSSALLSRYKIYGVSTGKKRIEPLELVGVIQLPPRDIFDFWGRTQQITITSKPVEIEILPLPEKGKPADFSGAVGEFTISASLDKKEIKTNEAFTLKVVISGKGNLDGIQEPKLELPPVFERYESHSTVKGNNKEFEIVLMPRETGNFVIPPITFSYFNPAKEEYRTVSTQPINITVLKGKEFPALPTMAYAPTKQALQLYGKDILYIKPNKPYIRGVSSLISVPAVYFLVFPLELFSIALGVAIKRRRQRLISDIAFYRSSRAYRVAKERLKKAKKEKEDSECFGFIYDALFRFIVDKLNLAEGSLVEDLVRELKERGSDDRILDELRSFFNTLELARFAPSSSSIINRDSLISKAEKLLKTLSKELK